MTTSTLLSGCERLSRWLALSLLTLLLAGSVIAQTISYGPGVQSTIDGLGALDTELFIVSFDGDEALSSQQLLDLQLLGVKGVFFNELPIAGVVATRSQINTIAARNDVRSIWLNEQLAYENEDATLLTGVDKLRTDASLRNSMGLPYSGKDIGVMVNDSGIDGLHPDLEYGSHVVQNVAAQTNIRSLSSLLPYTPTENVVNTDIGGGHGTHVAGTVGGTGAQSGGRHEGVAPGADLIGYGSGAGLFILDTIGAFDYALTHQFEYNIRVVSNSWGNTGDVGTDFNPNDPTNIATKKLADRGMIVVFSAGNSGNGEGTITGNFKKAPWVVTVAAGDKSGELGSFSSRGVKDKGGEVTVGGQTFIWEDRPTITAPGVDIISARASTSALTALSAQDDAEMVDPADLPYYTVLSGTSMACPHVSGIVALMLEADPTLDVYQVKDLLQATATNMPSREGWEVGAGYVNAYNAVVMALGNRTDFGSTVNLFADFNADAFIAGQSEDTFPLEFAPVGDRPTETFEVGPEVSLVIGRVTVPDNALFLNLIDPDGVRYGSGAALPVLGETAIVSAPGKQGTWTVQFSGIGGLSDVALDPLGLTNGYGVPGTYDVTIKQVELGGYTGLDDIAGHPAQAFIEAGVTSRYFDALNNGFRPDTKLKRGDLAQYLVMGGGVRQQLPTDGSFTFGDAGSYAPFAEAVTATGAAIRDIDYTDAGLMFAGGGAFQPNGNVTRAELAYAFIQGLGLEAFASGYDGDVSVAYNGSRIVLADNDAIPANLRGYVQLAIDFNILGVRFSLTQGEFDLQPTVSAVFEPNTDVDRADYAVAAVRYADSYLNGYNLEASDVNQEMTLAIGETESISAQDADLNAAAGVPTDYALDQNYPNPFNPTTTIRFALPAEGQVNLSVYNTLGQRVATLIDGRTMNAGTHSATFEARDLASGMYLYRLETPNAVITKTMMLLK